MIRKCKFMFTEFIKFSFKTKDVLMLLREEEKADLKLIDKLVCGRVGSSNRLLFTTNTSETKWSQSWSLASPIPHGHLWSMWGQWTEDRDSLGPFTEYQQIGESPQEEVNMKTLTVIILMVARGCSKASGVCWDQTYFHIKLPERKLLAFFIQKTCYDNSQTFAKL